ncbi:phosphonopyruvate decarboxylase [Polynucleobacter wuianus]|uniref:phosphonopyruvate decarboxylase n=1 Tax=Polynucleobacter wuianus TaxID=1743168 RepID=UPI001C0E694F|nr:phosphonopyruvate decarboxylase [Polynucleobacter wuianus]MBU3610987.1 phosphonopyruvate decarboxylase [Polynucleobacter wuianus]
MIDAKIFLEGLKDRGIGMLAGVPDSLLSSFCAQAEDVFGGDKHFIVANEGNAVALAAGHHLATNRIAAVYMQNSGLGNTINPLASLTDPLVYKIPVLMIIGWRGEPGKRDEPQHIKQGLITENQLKILGIPYCHLNPSSDLGQQLNFAFENLNKLSSPVAILVSSGTFHDFKLGENQSSCSYEMTREEAINFCIDRANEADLFVSTTGKASRELYEARNIKSQGLRDFLTVGSMGHASSIALGIALSVGAGRKVYCLDGDGAALMHLGAMPIIGSASPVNFIHILLNNGSHESVGGQPTVGYKTNFIDIAIASGYRHATSVVSKKELEEALVAAKNNLGPTFIEIMLRGGSRKDLARPSSTPLENKIAFMAQVQSV